MSEIIRAIKGMNDVVPDARERFLDSAIWDDIHAVAARVLAAYGYQHVRVPLVEDTALFARGIGEDTDVVAKEMYSFSDRGERQLTLRPEGTAGVVRAYIEHGFAQSEPVQRWWYDGAMFRAERPQKGRYRQFHQIGAEFFGSSDPAADAELLVMLDRLCKALGLSGYEIHLNSLGDDESRAAYRDRLRAFLREHEAQLSETVRARIDKNPLRFLDSKDPRDRELAPRAPDIVESLTPAAREHFDRVCKLLDASGLTYVRDPLLVRGLDYYTHTIFEFTTTALGAQSAILGGGRYDGLVKELGGPPTPAVGFGMGIERVAILAAEGRAPAPGPDLYLVPMQGAEAFALRLADEVRAAGSWRVEVDVTGRKVKAQMRRADKLRARTALVLGDAELANRRGNLKDLRVSSTRDVELSGPAIDTALTSMVSGANPHEATRS